VTTRSARNWRLLTSAFGDAAIIPNSGFDTIRYDTRCYFNLRLKADMSQLNLPLQYRTFVMLCRSGSRRLVINTRNKAY